MFVCMCSHVYIYICAYHFRVCVDLDNQIFNNLDNQIVKANFAIVCVYERIHLSAPFFIFLLRLRKLKLPVDRERKVYYKTRWMMCKMFINNRKS